MVNKIKLGEIISTQKGFAFKSSWYQDSGRPIVKVTDFTDFSINTNNLTNIDEDVAKDYIKYELKHNDILVQTVGSWPRNPKSVVGKVIHVPIEAEGALLNQNIVKLIPSKDIDPDYLFYLLRTKEFKDYIINTAQGAANQASITLESIKNFEFELPNITEQKIIGFTLRKFDDLLKNNKKRIYLLEKIAKLVYEEWFVKFRYPGNTIISEDIPPGWNQESITEVQYFKLITNNIKPYGGQRTYYATADIEGIFIVNEGIEYLFEEKPSRAQKSPLKNSVWFARMKDTYKVLVFSNSNDQITTSSILSSGFAGFSTGEKMLPFLYYSINSKRFHREKDKYATGATQVSINNEGISRIKILIPPKELIELYGEKVLPIINQILSLQIKNSQLEKIRDTILPEIIFNKIRVDNLTIPFQEVEA